MNYVVSRWVRVTSSSSGANSSSWGETWSCGWVLGAGWVFCFQLLCSSPEGAQQMLQVRPHTLSHDCTVHQLPCFLNSQTPHSTNRASSGKGHPFHLAYFLSVFLCFWPRHKSLHLFRGLCSLSLCGSFLQCLWVTRKLQGHFYP